MLNFDIRQVKSIEEAAVILKDNPVKAKVIAGGTDILGSIKRKIYPFPTEILVNLQQVPGLEYIKEEGDMLKIGAMTSLSAIAANPLVQKKYTALAQAASSTASPQLRNMGTIGGNVCQEIRCWYLRASDDYFDCLKKGGHYCYAIEGDNRYHSIFGGVRVEGLPCTSDCPSSIHIPEYLGLFQAGETKAAAEKLLENNPLPAITGRVCPHFCESKCNRGALDESVSIREVERELGDYILEHAAELLTAPINESGRRIAVVGAGPAGLSAAFYLRRRGHAVDVFDANAEPGGMLRYAIPSYRLPHHIIHAQIKALTAMGISFHQGVKVGEAMSLEQLEKDYDAVFLACGAIKERPSGIIGEENLISSLHFLRSMSDGHNTPPGKQTAVLGGGNAAIDVARSLLRMGAEATVIYRRTLDEMPAIREDVEKAKAEGVKFLFLTQPKSVHQDAGIKLGCVQMRLGEPDRSGRPRPVEVPGSDFELHFDAVITAFGEVPDNSLLTDAYLDSNGWFKAGGKVFGGGDFVSGASTVTQAMSGGRQTADAIDCFFTGDCAKDCTACAAVRVSACVDKTPRYHAPERPVAQRTLSDEDGLGLSRDQALGEARRCLNCACVAVNPSDIAPALVALNATLVTNKREIAADCFWSSKVPGSTVLEGDELITEIRIPAPPAGAKSAFVKFAERATIDFPVVNCAALLSAEEARICLNAVSPNPYRVRAAEDMVRGKTVNALLARQAAARAMCDAMPLSDNAYKVDIAAAMVERALLECC